MITMTYIPIVVDNKEKRSFDIYSRLLKERIVFLNGVIDDSLSTIIIAQLLFLESQNPNDDIYIYINSPGGSVTAGLAIYDTIQYIKPKINTICIGQAYSMGAFLLASGTKGKRLSLPNSRIMIHQPLGSFYGQATDILIHAKEILQIKTKLNHLLSSHTSQSLAKIKKDVERDHFMSAQEARIYGLIDQIIIKR